jgi:hypothetical protein
VIRKLAFVHIMKTAGTFVTGYLERQVLNRHRVLRFRNHRILNSWAAGLGRDWSTDELESFLHLPEPRLYVHNHVAGWGEDLIRTYRQAGFFTFTFVRHPGDALCSFYFWSRERDGDRGVPLDRFIATHIDSGRPWEIPPWWTALDHVAGFSEETFRDFLSTRFGHTYRPAPRQNLSANAGWSHYVTTGEISPDTKRLLEESEQFQRWRKIVGRTPQ